jgi:hypothetical protein
MSIPRRCPECDLPPAQALNRRQFVQTTSVAAIAAAASGLVLPAGALRAAESATQSEQLVQQLYNSLSADQRSKMCFAWDHQDDRGLLRTHVSNNWSITDAKTMNVGGEFYTADQRDMIEAIFLGLYNPDWHDKLRQQLQDDAGGYGRAQTIAIFGTPGDGKWEFVMTGRHLTIRCDGDSAEHVAFGGPIFYGHAAKGFDEAADHPGNVYWHQALKANKLFDMLDGKQRGLALISTAPDESAVAFRGAAGGYPGIAIAELSADQKVHAQGVLQTLLEPYRVSDRDQALQCLQTQGGLDKCSLAFYREEDIGADGVWDIWRIEGPSFVWHYRGAPHVHVWVNVADDPSVATNAAG